MRTLVSEKKTTIRVRRARNSLENQGWFGQTEGRVRGTLMQGRRSGMQRCESAYKAEGWKRACERVGKRERAITVESFGSRINVERRRAFTRI